MAATENCFGWGKLDRSHQRQWLTRRGQTHQGVAFGWDYSLSSQLGDLGEHHISSSSGVWGKVLILRPFCGISYAILYDITGKLNYSTSISMMHSLQLCREKIGRGGCHKGPPTLAGPLHCRVCRGGCYVTVYEALMQIADSNAAGRLSLILSLSSAA